ALDVHHIPPQSSFILTVNHYDRPELAAWWGIAAMVTAVAAHRTAEPRDVHFAMAREWWYPRGVGKWFKQPFTRWFFSRISRAYGTIPLPPALEMEEFRGQGALAIRRALALMRGERPALFGIAPEGRTGPNLALCRPPRGAGLFLLMLTHDRIPILPVGLYEDDNDRVLTVRFGAPYALRVPRDLPRDERDEVAARRVMTEIGKLLPARMWGVYREEITKAKDEEKICQNSQDVV
ncbi:MAG: hypothetical protein N2559_01925, partial [Anaerolineae bacterium]|nr:hypothetical protein [Anaerolineae bacterium]